MESGLQVKLQESIFIFPWWLLVGVPGFACLVTTLAAYYPARFVRRLDFWEGLRGGLTLAPQRNRHDWVPGGW